MIALDEDALLCDLAETYHIYDYQRLPVRRVAVFAAGLREDSRIMQRLSGARYPTDTLLLAAIADRLSLLWWAKTKDAEKGRNRPASIYDALAGRTKEPKREIEAFANGAEFDRVRQALIEAMIGGE